MATSKIYITTVPLSSDGGSTPPSVVFDAVLELSPSFSKKVTGYTLSDGSAISNHQTKSNPEFSLTGVVTTQPLTSYDNNLVGYETLSERPQKAYDQLMQWYKDDTEIVLAYEYDVRSPLAITNLSPVNNGTDSLTFNITFEEVRRATYSRVVLLQNVSSTLEESGKPPTGGRGTKEDKSDSRTWKVLETLDESIDALGDLSGN